MVLPPTVSCGIATENPNSKCVDIDSILESIKAVVPHMSDSSMHLIQSQMKHSDLNNKHGRRWDNEMIQLALSI